MLKVIETAQMSTSLMFRRGAVFPFISESKHSRSAHVVIASDILQMAISSWRRALCIKHWSFGVPDVAWYGGLIHHLLRIAMVYPELLRYSLARLL